MPAPAAGAQVHAEIEARRRVNLTQSRLRAFGQIHQLVRDLFRHRVKLTRVQVRNYHQMSGDVRIKIQDDKSVFAAVKHEVVLVVLGIGGNAAEHTTLRL